MKVVSAERTESADLAVSVADSPREGANLKMHRLPRPERGRGNTRLRKRRFRRFLNSHWQKPQVRLFSFCGSADFVPRLPANQLCNNNKIDELEAFACDRSSIPSFPFLSNPGVCYKKRNVPTGWYVSWRLVRLHDFSWCNFPLKRTNLRKRTHISKRTFFCNKPL